MNSSRRASKKVPIMTRRGSTMTSSNKSLSSFKMDDKILTYLGIAILIVLFFTSTCYYNGTGEGFTNRIKDGFSNVVKVIVPGNNNSLKDLDIIYFMSPGCPWCKKMSKVLEDEGALSLITVVDVNDPEGQKLAGQMGASDKGIPAFISKKMKSGSVGFKPSVAELIKSLTKSKPSPTPETPKMDPNDAVNAVQDLQIILFASPSCGWCNKMKTELSEVGVLEMIELVDVSTENGQATAKELLKEMRGVPATYSKKTGKSVVGYKPLADIIGGLS